MADCFDVLGIARGASVVDVRRAYRELARRWHPDRFADGPERLWAESKMININLAYEEALGQCASHGRLDQISPETEQLEDVRKLLGLGQLSAARQALMRVATRSAEWNYLFGAVLFRLGEMEKAVLYFGIAARQQPANAQYQTAYESAEALRSKNRRPHLFWRNSK
jgi:curved DNA-binding protein CbpA